VLVCDRFVRLPQRGKSMFNSLSNYLNFEKLLAMYREILEVWKRRVSWEFWWLVVTKWLLLVTGKRRGRFLSYRLVCGRSHYNGYYNRC